MRINRFLAASGLGSRRGVEDLIRAGRVTVNGALVEDLATAVESSDRVEVDGEVVHMDAARRLVIFHKPLGVVSSLRRQGSDPCLLDVLGPLLEASRLFHVGRLDRDSSGLLLLTDDGGLAQGLQHPRGEIWKLYEVEVDIPLREAELDLLRQGSVELDGRPCLPMRVQPTGDRSVRLGLREGRNRQIRRVLEVLGYRVERLHRTAVGPVELGGLSPGAWRDADAGEWNRLRRAVEGPAIDGPAARG